MDVRTKGKLYDFVARPDESPKALKPTSETERL